MVIIRFFLFVCLFFVFFFFGGGFIFCPYWYSFASLFFLQKAAYRISSFGKHASQEAERSSPRESGHLHVRTNTAAEIWFLLVSRLLVSARMYLTHFKFNILDYTLLKELLRSIEEYWLIADLIALQWWSSWSTVTDGIKNLLRPSDIHQFEVKIKHFLKEGIHPVMKPTVNHV